ncbi:hypothetical protein [Vibrio rhodolitus]|uniref:hypothetical protein n=1 Tax=Vibrio rhodolitus TaxID=2231649 RepID=UPI000E0C4339|nr:hypothetical protein [Vibrio rhodolitus]
MKKIIALACTALVSFSVFASQPANNSNSNQTARGEWVNCVMPDGSKDYIPSGVCRSNGGTFTSDTISH